MANHTIFGVNYAPLFLRYIPRMHVRYGRTNLRLQHCVSALQYRDINLLGMRIIIHSASYTLFAFDMPCNNDTNS